MKGVLGVLESVGPPVADLAFEADMLAAAAEGAIRLLVSSWPGTTLVLGYGQDPADVDLARARAAGIPVLRRLSGGTGVIHRDDLGVSLALPAGHEWARDVVGLYGRFLAPLERALRSLGAAVVRPERPRRASKVRSPVCFEDQLSDTLLRDGRKVVGCAQTRRRGGVLIHAAVLLGLDAGLYEELLGVDRARVAAALGAAVDGGNPAAVGRTVAAEIAAALGLEPAFEPRPAPSDGALAIYGEARWAPVFVTDSSG